MSKNTDLTGMVFNRLTVVSKCERRDGETQKWHCKCECGNFIDVPAYRLTNGNTKSCGCLKKERAAENGRLSSFKHGDTKTRLWHIWSGMRRRCDEKTNKDYARYGGRGIKVCDEWNEYTSFKDWAINNGYSEELSIDRIDTNGDYCPDNCKWATVIEQNNNRRSNHVVAYEGKSHTIAEWSRITSIPPKTLRYRIVSGWDLNDVFNTPIIKTNRLAKRG